MEENFKYTYSAKEQKEIKSIRQKYAAPKEAEDKMAQLRRLDARVESRATTAGLVVGIIGALIMGTGMSLILTDLGAALGTVISMLIGVAAGVVGMILVCLAYPIYNRTLKKERDKVSAQILHLTDELLK